MSNNKEPQVPNHDDTYLLDLWIENMKVQGFSGFVKEEHPAFILVRWKNSGDSQFSMMYKLPEGNIHTFEGLSQKWGEWEDLSGTLLNDGLSGVNVQELLVY